jgi:hypothetical protein
MNWTGENATAGMDSSTGGAGNSPDAARRFGNLRFRIWATRLPLRPTGHSPDPFGYVPFGSLFRVIVLHSRSTVRMSKVLCFMFRVLCFMFRVEVLPSRSMDTFPVDG